MKATVLIVDDEAAIGQTISLTLDYEGYTPVYTAHPNDALEKLKERPFDLVITDIQMPGMSGLQLIKQIRDFDAYIPVIVITAYGNVQNAVQATKLGAFDFLEKPVDREKLLIAVRNATEHLKLKKENASLRALSGETELLGESRSMKSIKDLLEKVADTEARVLITGENGTGKELVARYLHTRSSRNSGPFIDVNCAAIPNELIESELFGHEKGSFTGAVSQRIGKFELADGGTLFLDEIGDMSLQAQAKMLRAMEESAIERVGGSKKIPVNVRIVSATNKNIPELIKSGQFREDLYHRINVIPVSLPPLRERADDIPLLLSSFAGNIAAKYKKPVPEFTQDAITLIQGVQWTGNVRELRNFVERIIIILNTPVITGKDIDFLLPLEKLTVAGLMDTGNSFQEFKDKTEKAFILKQLEANNWNISKTAEVLDIQRSHLYNKMKKYGIDKGE